MDIIVLYYFYNIMKIFNKPFIEQMYSNICFCIEYLFLLDNFPYFLKILFVSTDYWYWFYYIDSITDIVWLQKNILPLANAL
jgi:hypothetical protein